jgi:hypothetical protein
VGVSAGGWVEKVEGVTRVRFVASNGWWSTGGRPAGGAQAGWPRSAPVRWCSGLGAGRGGAGEVGEAVRHSSKALDRDNKR